MGVVYFRCLKGKSLFQNGTQCSRSALEIKNLTIITASSVALILVFILLKLVGNMYGRYSHKTKSE